MTLDKYFRLLLSKIVRWAVRTGGIKVDWID